MQCGSSPRDVDVAKSLAFNLNTGEYPPDIEAGGTGRAVDVLCTQTDRPIIL